MPTFEDALKKLDEIDASFEKKDNRLLQLEKLFQGTAKIFQKQHNFVDQLKQKIELEQAEKEKLRTEKEKEITTLQETLQEKVKDLAPNNTEKQLLIYVKWKD